MSQKVVYQHGPKRGSPDYEYQFIKASTLPRPFYHKLLIDNCSLPTATYITQ